jgi:hypothetical protein
MHTRVLKEEGSYAPPKNKTHTHTHTKDIRYLGKEWDIIMQVTLVRTSGPLVPIGLSTIRLKWIWDLVLGFSMGVETSTHIGGYLDLLE